MTSAETKQKQQKPDALRRNAYLASCLSASAQSSRSPMRTADTSMYGSQTVKPRPIRSTAVLRMVLCGGSLGLGGCSRRNVRALPKMAKGKKTDKILFLVMFSLNYIFKV